MPKDPFKSQKNIAISVKPTTEFAKGNVMNGSRFKTIDVGLKGGQRLTLGKDKDEVKKKGRKRTSSQVQRILIEQKDFKIENGNLKPKTKRGKSEYREITEIHGELEFIGNQQFIVRSNEPLFERVGYFNQSNGGYDKKNKVNEASIKRLKKANVPVSIVRKIKTGRELSEIETEILHDKKLEVVMSRKRNSFVREYTGKTPKRMKNLRMANEKRGLY